MGLQFAGGAPVAQQFATFAAALRLTTNSPMTLCHWVRSLDTASASALMGLWDDYLTPTRYRGYRMLMYPSTNPTYQGRLQGMLGTGADGENPAFRIGTTDICDGGWHHVAMTWAGSGDAIHLWVDGVEESYTVTSGTPVYAPCSTNPFRMCYLYSNGSTYTLGANAEVFDVRVYAADRGSVIPTIFRSQGADRILGNLVARWPCIGEEGVVASGDVGDIMDVGSGGLNCTSDNGPTYSASALRLY